MSVILRLLINTNILPDVTPFVIGPDADHAMVLNNSVFCFERECPELISVTSPCFIICRRHTGIDPDNVGQIE